jgi:hypothetical protein
MNKCEYCGKKIGEKNGRRLREYAEIPQITKKTAGAVAVDFFTCSRECSMKLHQKHLQSMKKVVQTAFPKAKVDSFELKTCTKKSIVH